MGLRPGEQHPSRAVTAANNYLGKLALDASARPIDHDDEGWATDVDGATHCHTIEGGNKFVLQVLTHYVELTDTYYLLEVCKSELLSDKDLETYIPGQGITVLLKRGKTKEELDKQNANAEEPSDEHMAQVLSMFKELNG